VWHDHFAPLPGIAGMQLSLLKCVETHEITHPHMINQKKVEYSTKSATRIFPRVWCKFRTRFPRSERVALFISPERATLQEHRRRLLECAHEVCFPKACVGSEKIVKDI